MNAWFGTSWGSNYCQSVPQVPVPVGQTCIHCKEQIAPDDSGVLTPLVGSEGNVLTVHVAYYHVECWGRTLFGSVGHQLGLCGCGIGCNSDALYEGDSPEMSIRDSARAAWELARSRARTE